MVTSSYYPILGGAQTLIRVFSIKLNEMGIHTDVMTFNMDHKWSPSWKAKTEVLDRVKVFRIPALKWLPKSSNRITCRVNLIPGRFLNKLKAYDIIHFHYSGDLSFPLFSYFVKKPKILHLHGFATEFFKRYFLSKHIIRNAADLYISPTQMITRGLIEIGVPKHKIRPFPNGPIDIDIFHPSGEKEHNLILFVGRISSSKGLHVLLKSLSYLERSVHLVAIGPPQWEAKYFEGILKSIDKENRKGIHKITYLGAQDQTNVVRWYQKASVFVLPSLQEAGGIVNLEALSCETPVVATDVGGVPEFVHNGENGLLVPPNDPEKLAGAIQYLLDNENIRVKFGQEGRKWVEKNFSLQVVIDRLCGIYKEISTSNLRPD